MAQFHVSRIAVNHHHEMYDDLIRSLVGGLIDLGHSCTTAKNHYEDGAINILVGSTIFASRHMNLAETMRGRPYILYQLEQLDEENGLLAEWPEYWELLSGATAVWDYAPSSARFLKGRGLTRVSILPPAFHPCLDSFRPSPEPDLDVLFLGTMHPRRQRILEEIVRTGVQLGVMIGKYGAERNAVIVRTRIVLNIHAWDHLNMLETVRLSLLLANHCFVISETSDHNPYGDGVVYADYGALVATCLDYLQRPAAERQAVADRGFDAVRGTTMAEQLRWVLAESLGL